MRRRRGACRRGDAAHRFPPTGGLGLDSGIQEAKELAERLAGLERRLASLTDEERQQLEKAIEAQRSHFLSDGSRPDAHAR